MGRVIRSHTRRTAELERLTRELALQRDARAREAVTVERARIARELHDVVAHKISVMGVQAAAARRVLTGEQPVIRQALEAIESTGRETIDDMRHMLGVLREHNDELALAPQPGLRDLDALAVQMRAAGLPVEIQIEGVPRALPAGLELSAYRIVQEGLTNTLKHAGPSRANVAVRYLERAVELEIVDDGPGATGSDGTGNGLVGMRERVAMFGGELDAGRREEGGWSLRARLPVAAT
jgi:signal transduction histidine kinase